MTRAVRPGPRGARDPFGIGPVGSWIAPILSMSSACSSWPSSRSTCSTASCRSDPAATARDGRERAMDPGRTAAPSNVVVVPDEAAFEGSIVYAKGGNIWVQVGQGRDAADRLRRELDAVLVARRRVGLLHPDDPRRAAAGRSAAAGALRHRGAGPDADRGRRQRGAGTPGDRVLQAGSAVAGRTGCASRSCRPTARRWRSSPTPRSPRSRNVVLQFFDLETGEVHRRRRARERGPRPPGSRTGVRRRLLLYAQNGRDGRTGAPVIVRYETATGGGRS